MKRDILRAPKKTPKHTLCAFLYIYSQLLKPMSSVIFFNVLKFSRATQELNVLFLCVKIQVVELLNVSKDLIPQAWPSIHPAASSCISIIQSYGTNKGYH